MAILDQIYIWLAHMCSATMVVELTRQPATIGCRASSATMVVEQLGNHAPSSLTYNVSLQEKVHEVQVLQSQLDHLGIGKRLLPSDPSLKHFNNGGINSECPSNCSFLWHHKVFCGVQSIIDKLASLMNYEYDFVHIAAGDLLRAEVAAGTENGRRAKECMEKGQLVPDEIVVMV
ncbi:ATP:AMP phosphotransferase [Forsythia ovata]|uniref:adenylate kinase n=1 Tax=Forsythia ovata TaxID=205694 RepID=A0ABD1TME7_9LAMI